MIVPLTGGPPVVTYLLSYTQYNMKQCNMKQYSVKQIQKSAKAIDTI